MRDLLKIIKDKEGFSTSEMALEINTTVSVLQRFLNEEKILSENKLKIYNYIINYFDIPIVIKQYQELIKQNQSLQRAIAELQGIKKAS